MSMLYLAQTAADARPGLAVGYIAGKILMIGGGVYGLVKLVTRKRRNTLPPPPPNYGALQGYRPGYWAPPGWPPQAPPTAAPGQMPPWPPQSLPPTSPQ
jgi:hypothetical protein